MYNVFTVAEYVISQTAEGCLSIGNLKLQKILYLVQVEFLASYGRPCFRDDVEAWDFGPVVPAVYEKYKPYGAAAIPWTKERKFPFSKRDSDKIDGVIAATYNESAAELTRMTMNQKPWRDAYKYGERNIISKNAIREYFKTHDWKNKPDGSNKSSKREKQPNG